MSRASISEADWTSSSSSQANGGECVEGAPAHVEAYGAVPVRDSKQPTGPVLMVSARAWAALVDAASAERL